MSLGVGDVAARIRAVVEVDTAALTEGLAKAEEEVKGSGSRMGKATHVAGLVAAAGFGMIVAGAYESVKAGIKAQQVQAQLSLAIKNAGLNAKTTGAEFDSFADKQAKFGVNSDEAKQALTQFVVATGSAKLSMKDLSLSEDIAAAKHIDLATAVQMVTKAQAGSTRMMTAAGIIFTPYTNKVDALNARITKLYGSTSKIPASQMAAYESAKRAAQMFDKQRDATELLRIGFQKYGGAAEAQSKTLSGRWAALKAEAENLEIAVGEKLLPYVERFANVLADHTVILRVVAGAIGAIVAASLIWTAAVKAQAAYTAIASAATSAYATITGTATVATEAQAGAQEGLNAAMDANPIGLVAVALAALTAGVIYAYTHFKVFRDVVNSVFDFLKTAVSDVIGFVKAHWELILGILTGPIGIAIAVIATHWTTLKNDASDAFSWVISKGGSLISWFAALPGKIASAIGNVGSDMWSALEDGLNYGIGFIDTAVKALNQFIANIPFGPSWRLPYLPKLGGGGGGSGGAGSSAPGPGSGQGRQFAHGGIVGGGVAGRDSVHAILTPGEMVLNHGHIRSVSNMLGAPLGRVLGFASGGVVPAQSGTGQNVTVNQYFEATDPDPFVAMHQAKFAAQAAFG